MPSRRETSRVQSAKMAFCGVIVALSVAILIAGGWLPIATYCAPLAAGLLLLPVMMEYGKKAAATAFAAAALLALMLDADKEAAFFYLFFGNYPLVKLSLDRVKPKALRVAAKVCLFLLLTVLLYALLGVVLGMNAVLAEFREMGAILTAGFALLLCASLLLYDRLILPVAVLYARRLRPKLRFLR